MQSHASSEQGGSTQQVRRAGKKPGRDRRVGQPLGIKQASKQASGVGAAHSEQTVLGPKLES
eukprot:1159933-Pelagomonas_calceolata.AAC.5